MGKKLSKILILLYFMSIFGLVFSFFIGAGLAAIYGEAKSQHVNGHYTLSGKTGSVSKGDYERAVQMKTFSVYLLIYGAMPSFFYMVIYSFFLKKHCRKRVADDEELFFWKKNKNRTKINSTD